MSSSHHDHGHGDAPPKMESLHGPVVLALLMAGGLVYYFQTRQAGHGHDGEGEARAAPTHAGPPRRASTPPPERRGMPERVAAPTPSPAPSPTAAAAPGSADCAVNLETDPPGADVYWGMQPLGKTPISRVAVPCGPARLAIKHPLFSDVERDVTVLQGAPFNLHEKLQPGRSRLSLSSSPPGATFSVNGSVVGTGTPTFLGTIGDEITVSATLDGHKPWSQTIRLSTRRMQLTAPLDPR